MKDKYGKTGKKAAVFLDRDGTINEEVGYLDSLDKLQIIPCAFEAVRLINGAGLLSIVVTNQAGIARGLFDEPFVNSIHGRLTATFQTHSARLDAFYYCPHHPTAGIGPYAMACDCRKPEPGMLLRAAEEWNIDLEHSFMIGDTAKDVEVGQRVGAKGILVETGYGGEVDLQVVKPDYVASNVLDAVRWILSANREK